MSLFEQAKNTSATVARAQSYMSLIISIIVALIFIIIGYLIIKNSNNYIETPATVISNNTCEIIRNSNSTNFKCIISIEYPFDNNAFTANNIETFSSIEYKQGQNIVIYVNKDSPKDIKLETFPKFVAWIFIIVGIILILLKSYDTYLIKTNDTYAAISGISTMSRTANFAKDGVINVADTAGKSINRFVTGLVGK